MVHLYKLATREVKCRNKAVLFIMKVTFKLMGIPFSVLYIFQNLFELDVTVWKAEIFLNVIYIDNLHAKIIFVILAWCKYGI
jgi:hypothetical protein